MTFDQSLNVLLIDGIVPVVLRETVHSFSYE